MWKCTVGYHDDQLYRFPQSPLVALVDAEWGEGQRKHSDYILLSFKPLYFYSRSLVILRPCEVEIYINIFFLPFSNVEHFHRVWEYKCFLVKQASASLTLMVNIAGPWWTNPATENRLVWQQKVQFQGCCLAEFGSSNTGGRVSK